MNSPLAAAKRRIYANRTLNLRAIKAIGYDMDYTLIHYKVDVWEDHAYAHVRRRMLADGWPVESLAFDPQLMLRGLIIDTELGNILKANRFGFVKRAYHGTRPLEFEQMRAIYSRVIVDLSERRFQFMNTLFSLSEACLYAQLVDLLDRGAISQVHGYEELYRTVRQAIDYAHLEGRLKQEIIDDPDRFVDLDPEIPLALLDQHHAGKKLLLITNSEWHYTQAMMSYAFDRFLPAGMSWRELFDMVIVEARKPSFFTQSPPAFQIVSEDGLLKPVYEGLEEGRLYLGGNAKQVEDALGVEGEQILFVGDHVFSDVHVSKSIQRWRTALILRELEDELDALEGFEADSARLEELMAEKETLEAQLCALRVEEQRGRHGYGPRPARRDGELAEEMTQLRTRLLALDETIAPLARASSLLASPSWGLLMRAGNDKSHLARQVERYADIYMSRVSCFAAETPFAYLRASRGSLPHDPS